MLKDPFVQSGGFSIRLQQHDRLLIEVGVQESAFLNGPWLITLSEIHCDPYVTCDIILGNARGLSDESAFSTNSGNLAC